jgi:hypothetical protein
MAGETPRRASDDSQPLSPQCRAGHARGEMDDSSVKEESKLGLSTIPVFRFNKWELVDTSKQIQATVHILRFFGYFQLKNNWNHQSRRGGDLW